MKSEHSKTSRLSWKTIFSYSVGDIFGGGAFTLVGMLFLNYLTDSALISGAIAGSMLLIGKIWDALIDPLIGNLSDHVNSRFGRRRIFFLAGIFHISASFALLWLPLTADLWVKVIYYTIAYLLFATSFSFTMVPYHALVPEITKSYNERSRLMGVRSIISNLSTLVAGVVPMIIIHSFVSLQNGYFGMGIIFGIFYALPWIFVFLGTKEIDPPTAPTTSKITIPAGNPFINLFKNGKTVLANRSYRLLLGLYIFAYTATDVFMAMILYYLNNYLEMPGSYTMLIGIFMVTEILFVSLYVKIANTHGKQRSFIIGTIIWGMGLLVALLMSPTASPYLLYLSAFIMGAGASGTAFSPWAMLPETTDVDELISGLRREGIYSGFMTFIRQLSQAVALWLTGIYIDLIGYDATIVLSESTKVGIKLFFSIAPLILLCLALLFALRYPVNHTNYKVLREEIDRLKNGGNKKEVLPSVQEICEKLTGKPYDTLWEHPTTPMKSE